jgi:hypothetical protein
LCEKCFEDTNVAYALKTRCIETDQILRNLELQKEFQNVIQPENSIEMVAVKIEDDFDSMNSQSVVIKTEFVDENEMEFQSFDMNHIDADFALTEELSSKPAKAKSVRSVR